MCASSDDWLTLDMLVEKLLDVFVRNLSTDGVAKPLCILILVVGRRSWLTRPDSARRILALPIDAFVELPCALLPQT